MYKALIFDFFDVIHTDSFHAWMKTHGYKREGKFAEASRLLDSGQIDMNGFYQKLSEASSLPAQAIESEFEKFAEVDPQIINFIKELHTSYTTALLSNSDANYLRPILKKHALEALFDEIMISSEVGVIKPQPEIFSLMLKKLEVKASEAIFIDDNQKYVDAAKALGITSIQYRNLLQLQEELNKTGIKTH